MDYEALAQELYAATLARYTPAQQELARVGALKRCREYVANLADAIETKDVDKLLAAVHRHNDNSRRIFKTLTGIDAGKTDKSCRAAIKQYVGTEFYEQHLNETTAQEAERRAEWRRQEDAKEREAELGQRIEFRLLDNTFQVGTVRDMIDQLFAMGFRPEASKRGFANTVKLRRPGESITLRTKYAMAYALEKAAEAVTV